MRSRVHTVLNYFMTVYFIYIYTPQYSAWRWLLIVETCCCKLYKITVNQSCVRLLIIKPTRCTDFSNLFLEWNSTRFGQFLCPSSGVLHCTHSNSIRHTGLLTACEQDKDGSQFHTKHVEFHSKNQFEKLVHLVGFIIRNLKADYYVSDHTIFCRETYGHFKAVQPIGNYTVYNFCFDTNLGVTQSAFTWFSQQTVIISLIALTHRSLINESSPSVYCEVQTRLLMSVTWA